MIEIITRYLSEYNFSPVFKSDNYYHYIYSGKIETSRFGDVSIDLVFSKDGIISFPTAYINEKSREKFTPFHFPHLDDNWVLCYHDNSIVFDIVNIKSSIDIIFTNISGYFDKENGATELLERFLKNIGVNDGMTDEERTVKRERLEREDKEKLVPEYAGIENEKIMQMFDKKKESEKKTKELYLIQF